MAESISLKTDVQLGVVPTHVTFAGGFVPDESGRLPRADDGSLRVVTGMSQLVADSPVAIRNVQIILFPGVDTSDTDELVAGLRELGLDIHMIMMIGGADPMNPADEDAVVEMLVAGAEVAKRYDITQIASTSIEEWMAPDAKPKTGADFDAGVAQNVRAHCRAHREANLADSCVEHWHIEFLRGGEFQTFTDIEKCWSVVAAANRELGEKFFKILVDAAHCGDSELDIPRNEEFIARIAEADELGIFHASAKTTRGCLTTDDGWIGALLAAAARTGKLEYVFVEIFNHEDPALEPLRNLGLGHSIDTTDGRSYHELVLHGLTDVSHRLNNFVSRGLLTH